MAQYGDAAAAQDQRLLDDLQQTQDKLAAQRTQLEAQLAAARARRTRRRTHAPRGRARQRVDDEAARHDAVERQVARDEDGTERARRRPRSRNRPGCSASPNGRRPAVPRARALPPAPAPTPESSSGLPTPSPGALLAVAYAEAQLGKPYVYAGAGPDVFDCSGPHDDGVGAERRRRWCTDPSAVRCRSRTCHRQLQPGDLVFFGDSGPTNHHVGIVVGPGLMIDAPHTGAYVELVSYFRPDLVPLGARPSAPPPSPRARRVDLVAHRRGDRTLGECGSDSVTRHNGPRAWVRRPAHSDPGGRDTRDRCTRDHRGRAQRRLAGRPRPGRRPQDRLSYPGDRS